jgi:hypothetical protein
VKALSRLDTKEIHLKSVKVSQDVLDLLLRHDLPERRHHVAARKNHLSHALVVGGHSALRQERFLKYSLQAASFFVAL